MYLFGKEKHTKFFYLVILSFSSLIFPDSDIEYIFKTGFSLSSKDIKK